MANPIKFKEAELKELTDLRQGYVDTQNQLGRLSVQKVLAEQLRVLALLRLLPLTF